MDPSQAIDNITNFFKAEGIAGKEKQILEEILSQTEFIPQKLLGRSNYWGSEKIGAALYLGSFQSQSAILKIQGVRPEISEVEMIEAFARQNQSRVIRPPKIYFSLPWSDDRRFEAIIMEEVIGQPIISESQLATDEQLTEFFEIFVEYRQKCRNKPWLPRPEIKAGWVEDKFLDWKKISHQLYPDHPLRQEVDWELIQEAVKIIAPVWGNIQLEFINRHVSVKDFIKIKPGEVIIFSNLFWSWRPPFVDAVFAYHWHLLSLEKIDDLTPLIIDQQRQFWSKHIKSLDESQKSPHLLQIALLERATAGLLLDSLAYSDPKKNSTKLLVASTRDQVKQLIKSLSR